MTSSLVCVGKIVASHGVRGLVKLKSFTADPAAIASYRPLSDESGRRSFVITLHGAVKDLLLARIEGVNDRDQADALRGLDLFVERHLLPPPADAEEFYYVDLIGLAVQDKTDAVVGKVVAIHDFGGGEMLEIHLTERRDSAMLPFTRAMVPVVDVAGGRVVIDPPADWLSVPPPEDAADAEDTE